MAESAEQHSLTLSLIQEKLLDDVSSTVSREAARFTVIHTFLNHSLGHKLEL